MTDFFYSLGCSESGEMCAMKEVTLFSDDAKSRECAQQLGQVNFTKPVGKERIFYSEALFL